MTTEDRIARLEQQVVDLSELVLGLSGRCLALGVAVGNAPPGPAGGSPAGTELTTSALLDRVYSSLLAMPVGQHYLDGFTETAGAIRHSLAILAATADEADTEGDR